MPQDTNIITDAKNNIDLACSSTFRRIKPRPKRGLSSFDCSGNLIHRSPPLLIKSQEHVATPSESQCPSQRDALVIDLNLFSSVPRPHYYSSHWSVRHGTELWPDWLGEEEPFIHIPPWPQGNSRGRSRPRHTASSPVWPDIVGRGSIDSNEKIHSSHRVVFSFYQTSPDLFLLPAELHCHW